MLRKLYFIALLSVALGLFGYNIALAHEGHEDGQHENQAVEEQGKVAVIGNPVGVESNKLKIQCPVMKTWFVPNEKTDKAVYEGKTYYFCCKSCKPMFEKEPAKYLKG